MSIRLIRLAMHSEQDVVSARQRARQIAGLLGFDPQDQVRIATAASEIARNAFRYAGGGEVEFEVAGEHPPQQLLIHVRDKGKGIEQLDAVLEGRYRSSTGMGLGITGTRRLMDGFELRSGAGGTSVTMRKRLPESARPIAAPDAGRIAKALAEHAAASPVEEVQQQNRELMRALDDLRQRQEEMVALNRELEDTNRGVVALYAELEARADLLRQADEAKTRFLSNMSHELRTPLNSIRALTGMLLARIDGPVNAEQEVQLQFVKKGADTLAELVDDLLDLAKIEAGRIDVNVAPFSVEELFSALRGMLRPLLVSDKVALRFDAAPGLPALHTDEGKVSQILRNLISNALKFTEQGEIRVTAFPDGKGGVTFSVADTGIGIPRGEQERIFEEFTQVRSALQAKVKGTGLGLPLCRKLAKLLGGEILVESEPGQGSIFSFTLPMGIPAGAADAAFQLALPVTAPARLLVIDDDAAMRYMVRRFFDDGACEVLEAGDARQGLDMANAMRPELIVLDLRLPDGRGEDVLDELGAADATRAIPVIVATSETLTPVLRDRLSRAAAVVSKGDFGRASIDEVLRSAHTRAPARP